MLYTETFGTPLKSSNLYYIYVEPPHMSERFIFESISPKLFCNLNGKEGKFNCQ